MSTLNINAAGTFGILSYVLAANIQDNSSGQYDYSYGYVESEPVYYAWWSYTFPSSYPSDAVQQTTANVQAMQNMFTDQSSIYPGVTANTGYSTYLWQFASLTPDTSTMTVEAIPLPAGSYNVDLSTATQVSSNDAVVAASSLEFVFIPGSTESQTLTYSQGATISNQVTNGVTSTYTNAQGQTVALSETCATSYTGTVKDEDDSVSSTVSASESAAISYAWSQTSSQSTNYTDSNTSQTSTMVASSTTVNVNTATPNSDGTYTYGSYTLVPGQTYISQITLSEGSWNAPITQSFQISGPPMAVPNGTSLDTDGLGMDYINYIAYQNPISAEQAVYYANTYGYDLISGCDSSLFTYVTGQTDYATYTGMVSSTSSASVNATVVIVPVATTTTADNSGVTTSGSPDGIYISAAAPAAHNTAMLDLGLASTKLKSNHGVYFNTAAPGVESALVSKYLAGNPAGLLTLNGGNQDSVILGDLNYSLTGFSNSNVTLGNGSNTIAIGVADNGNRFEFGDGNNSISLSGKGNNLFLGGGANYIEVTGSTGKNFVIDSTGATALMINDASGFTQVSKWDQTQDSLHFGSNVNLSDVKVTFNYSNWSYNVYVKDNLVANLISVGGLSLSDPVTKITSTSAYAPSSIAIQSNQGFLTGLYADAFSRAPDAAGLAYWENVINHGGTRAQVTQTFFTSPEYESQFQTSSQYVSALFHDLLGRAPDSNILASWSQYIDNGGPDAGANVVSAILASPEFVHLVGVNHPA